MWSSSRRLFLFSAFALSACGFEPVYGPGGDARALLGQVDIEVQNGRAQFEFRDRFQEVMQEAGSAAPYITTYDLKISERDIVISQAQGITRWSVAGTLTYDVIAKETGVAVFSGRAQSNTAYNATSGTFQTDVARTDAIVRLARDLADKVTTRIVTTAGDWAE